MKVTVRVVDELKRELHFVIPKERVSAKLDEVYEGLGKTVTIEGYEPGNVPRNVLEAHHSQAAREELLRKLVPEVYQEGIEQEDLFPLDMPDISDLTFDDGALRFKANLEVKPEVKIKNYKGIQVKRKSNEPTDEEIDKTLAYFKRGRGPDERTDVAIDDNLAKGLGYPNVEAFKNSLVRQLEFDKDRHNRLDLENQVIEALLKNAELTTPLSLVRKQVGRRTAEQTEQLKKQGLSEDDINKQLEESEKSLRESVERDIRVYLILEAIAREENIEVEVGDNLPARVMEFLLRQAEW